MANTSKKILLIEDEKSLSKVVELNLKLEGFEVVCISNGRTAIEHADKVGEYDLVILDVMLPEVSGWDICSMYKSVTDTPILFVSAKGTSSDKIKGLKLGADDFLAKPFDLEELLLRVQVLILRHQKKGVKNEQLMIGDFDVNILTYEVKRMSKSSPSFQKEKFNCFNSLTNTKERSFHVILYSIKFGEKMLIQQQEL